MGEFDEAIRKVMLHEGGYVNDPDDPGGETKFGISKRQYPDLDIRGLTPQAAREIYYHDYWYPLKGFAFGQDFAMILLDTAVNIGVKRTIKMAQKIAGVEEDGILGPITLNALRDLPEERLILRFVLARIRFYISLVKRKPKMRKFFFGWISRTIDYL